MSSNLPGARAPVVRYPGYRQFDLSRSEVNDAMMALLIGSRLAAHLLSANAGSVAKLPVIYPAVPGVARLNRTVTDASLLLVDAERHLAAMGIPYVQATYEVMVHATITVFQESGFRPPSRSEKKKGLMGLHEYVATISGLTFQTDDLSLLDVVRQMRNAIVHDGSRLTKGLATAWNGISQSARDGWINASGQPLDVSGPHLTLASGELIGTLAVTKKLARDIANIAASVVVPPTWAAVLVDDFLVNYERKIPKDGILLRRKVAGWARMYYQVAALSTQLIEHELQSRGL